MATWLKTSQYSINLDKLVYIRKFTNAVSVSLDIQGMHGSVLKVYMHDSIAATSLVDLIIKSLQVGGDLVIDASPYEKI